MCYYPWRPRITTTTAIACELACEPFWQYRTSCDCESKPLFLSEGWLYVHNCALTASCRTFCCFFFVFFMSNRASSLLASSSRHMETQRHSASCLAIYSSLCARRRLSLAHCFWYASFSPSEAFSSGFRGALALFLRPVVAFMAAASDLAAFC